MLNPFSVAAVQTILNMTMILDDIPQPVDAIPPHHAMSFLCASIYYSVTQLSPCTCLSLSCIYSHSSGQIAILYVVLDQYSTTSNPTSPLLTRSIIMISHKKMRVNRYSPKG